MTIGLIIIGDEILSGKRVDKHFSKVVELLSARGLQLGWVEYIGDQRARITATLCRTFASEDIVFCCGGIGATPDDHTRQCAAAALGLPLVLHPQAKAKIQERIADMAAEAGVAPELDLPENLQRLKMGEFPLGARIIPNPFNKIPGFSFARHHFVPGFPVMVGPMIASVLDTEYAHLFHQQARLEKSLLAVGAMESRLTPLMEAIEAEFPLVTVFSLPSVGDAHTPSHIELGVKGEPQQVEAAFAKMREELQSLGIDLLQPS